MSRDDAGQKGRSPAGEDGVVEIEYSLTRLMRQANRPTVWNRLASASGISVDRVEYATLARIEEASAHGAARLTDLAELMGIDISTVSRQVRNVEKAGLVERSCDPLDQRASRLRLTPAGQDTLDRTRRASQDAMRGLLASWSTQERAMFATLMGRLVDDLSTLNSADGSGESIPDRPGPSGAAPDPSPASPVGVSR